MGALSAAQIEVLRDLRLAWPDRRVMLVGAQALAQHIDMSYRDTKDIDFAVAVDMPEIPGDLERCFGWKRDAKQLQRFTARNGLLVDLVPTGRNLLDAGSIEWSDGRIMNLSGFDLAFEQSTHVSVADDLTVDLPSAPALALLKMQAWLDRRARTNRDIRDLAHLFETYVREDDERRWTGGVDVEIEFTEAGAFLIGIDMAKICKERHRDIVTSFFDELDLASWMSTGPPRWNLDENVVEKVRAAFELGFKKKQ